MATITVQAEIFVFHLYLVGHFHRAQNSRCFLFSLSNLKIAFHFLGASTVSVEKSVYLIFGLIADSLKVCYSLPPTSGSF